MLKEFCPYCGNRTLQKVSMTVEEDGSIRYFLSRRKPISTKGMKVIDINFLKILKTLLSVIVNDSLQIPWFEFIQCTLINKEAR